MCLVSLLVSYIMKLFASFFLSGLKTGIRQNGIGVYWIMIYWIINKRLHMPFIKRFIKSVLNLRWYSPINPYHPNRWMSFYAKMFNRVQREYKKADEGEHVFKFNMQFKSLYDIACLNTQRLWLWIFPRVSEFSTDQTLIYIKWLDWKFALSSCKNGAHWIVWWHPYSLVTQ